MLVSEARLLLMFTDAFEVVMFISCLFRASMELEHSESTSEAGSNGRRASLCNGAALAQVFEAEAESDGDDHAERLREQGWVEGTHTSRFAFDISINIRCSVC